MKTSNRLAAVSVTLIFFGSVCLAADESLQKAAYNGDVALVKTLLSKGADTDARDSSGGTALHAAMFQKKTGIVQLLIAYGFDPNAIGPRNGYTPLHDAVWANNVSAARLLLQHGARNDIKGKDGLSPYEKAVRDDKKEMAELLKRDRQ